MQKLLLALIAVLAIAGVVYVLLPVEAPTDESEAVETELPDGPGEEDSTPALADTSGAGLAEATTLRTDRAGPAERDAVVSTTTGRDPDRPQLADGGSIPGLVILPEGLPADEEVRIVVHPMEPRMERNRFEMDFAGASVSGGSIEQAAREGIQAQRTRGGEEDPDGLEPLAYSIAENGTFSFDFPPQRTRAWVTLESKYLIIDEPLQVSADSQSVVQLTPRLGAYVSGRIRLPSETDESELEDLTEVIEVLRFEPDRLASAGVAGLKGKISLPRTATLHDDLTFEIRGVEPKGKGSLQVRSERFACQQLGGLRPEPGQHIRRDVTLVRGADVSGLVVDEAGQPVAGVEVEASIDPLMFGMGGFEVRQTETAVDGSFRLAHVAPGQVKLTFETRGFMPSSKELELVDGQAEQDLFVELSRGNRIHGTVLDVDGQPLPEIEVEVDFDMSFMAGMEAMNAMRGGLEGEDQTDADGYFEITGLGTGPFVVATEIERDGRTWNARLANVRPDGDEVVLRLEAPVGISGIVVNDLNEPLGKFAVTARSKTEGMVVGLGAETHSDDFTDDEGRFFLDGLRSGKWELLARAEGHARSPAVAIELPLDLDQPITLVAPRAGTASGVVLDPQGNPVSGASVALVLSMEEIGRIAVDGLPPSIKTDELGRFELSGLPPDDVTISASADGFGDSEALGVELEPGATVDGLALRLVVGGRILGVLYGDDGEPKQGSTVIAQNPANPLLQDFATTDSDGEFVFEALRPGTYQVISMGAAADADASEDMSAMLSGMKFVMAEVKDGEDTEVVLGAPPEDPVRVSGVVRSAGEPVAGVMLTFIPDGGDGMDAMKFIQSKADGSFQTTLDEPGRYLVNVQKITGTGQQQTLELLERIPEAEEHRLDIELPNAVIAGRVTRPNGDPAGGVRVTLNVSGPLANGSFTGGQYAEISTEADGSYRLEWLRPGTYAVGAGGPLLGGFFGDGGQKTFGRQIRRGLQVEQGTQLMNVDFQLEEPGKLVGRVVGSGGTPAGGAAIFVRNEDGELIDRISMVTADQSGRFEYTGLSEGTYQVTARTGETVSHEPARVVVRAGEEAETSLVLDTGTILLVSLTDDDGQPIDCRVVVTGPDGQQLNGMYSYQDLMQVFSQGNFSTTEQRVGPVAPGRYTVEAFTNDGRDARKSVTITDQVTRRVRLRLD